MFKVITIENKHIPMKSDGGTLREYRHFFKRDMIADLLKLKNGMENNTDFDMEVLENLAWILAHRANNSIKPIDEWLAQFENPLSLFENYEKIMEVIDYSNVTTVQPKKKKHKARR